MTSDSLRVFICAHHVSAEDSGIVVRVLEHGKLWPILPVAPKFPIVLDNEHTISVFEPELEIASLDGRPPAMKLSFSTNVSNETLPGTPTTPEQFLVAAENDPIIRSRIHTFFCDTNGVV